MPKVFTKRLFNQRGITLIELIAVILIIGIIAAVGVPVVFNQIKNAEENALLANIDVINGAVERYATMEFGYPTIAGDTAEARLDALITELKGAGSKGGGPYLRADFVAPTGIVTVPDAAGEVTGVKKSE